MPNKKQTKSFSGKNKKIQKKFREKAVWGGLVYHTGGGCTLGGLQVQFSTMQPTAQWWQFHTHIQWGQKRVKLVRITYFPKSGKILKLWFSTFCEIRPFMKVIKTIQPLPKWKNRTRTRIKENHTRRKMQIEPQNKPVTGFLWLRWCNYTFCTIKTQYGQNISLPKLRLLWYGFSLFGIILNFHR